MAAPWEKSFVCWNITRVKSMVTVQRAFRAGTQRTRLQDLADLKARIIAAVKNVNAPMLTRVCMART